MSTQALFRFSFILLALPFLSAATLPRLSLEEMVSTSDVIASGRIVRATAALDPEKRFIWTHYELSVRSTLKGPAAAIVTISEPGGTLNGITLHVPGATRYAVGDEVAVFLYRTPIGYLRTANYGQGRLLVSPDERIHLNRSIDLGGAVIAPGAAAADHADFESLEGMQWSTLANRVRRVLARPEARR